MDCPHCGSSDVRKKGIRRGRYRYRCNNCHKWHTEVNCVEWLSDAVETKYLSTIPPGEPENYSVFEIGRECFPIIVGADAHIPYHDSATIELFINRAVSIGAKTILLNGDWLDCYQLSRFQRDPRMRRIEEEMGTAHQIFSAIRSACPDARIIYKYGNHEERYDSYLMRQAPDLAGLKSSKLENQAELGLAELKIEVVDNRRVVKADHLYIIHGHEYGSGVSSPVNPARGLYLKTKKSAMCGHYHQSSEHTETAINGDVATCWSGGCLCGLHPQYMPLNKWNHGFTEIQYEDGFFTVRNRRIVNVRLL